MPVNPTVGGQERGHAHEGILVRTADGSGDRERWLWGKLGDDAARPSPTPTPRPTVEVTFTYAAATEVDPRVNYESCSPGGPVFTTHLHFIWLNWEDRRYMDPVGADSFEHTDEVPVGELRTALHDPNVCLQGDVYVAPTTLRANGVLLTREVTVRDGIGLAFTVAAEGTVAPQPRPGPRSRVRVPRATVRVVGRMGQPPRSPQ